VEYFVKKDLSKDELQTQIAVLQRVLKLVLFFVLINLVRVVFRLAIQRRMR
jgi:hypothetical protein